MDSRIENLISAIGKLRDFNRSPDDIKEIKNCLNMIFVPDAKCTNAIFTTNWDKLPFGCVVFPVIGSAEYNNFMITGESVRFKNYEVEIDSKLFDYGLSDQQVAEVVLFNVYHLIKDTKPLDNIREVVDDFFIKNGTELRIRNSVQYEAILALGLVDALHQVTSCLYLPDEVKNDAYLESLELYDFEDTLNKIYKRFPDCNIEATRMPKLTMLEWCLRLYINVETERIPSLHLLAKAKDLTASVLYQNKFNGVITALNRIDTENFVNEAVQHVFTEAKHSGGLLARLKYDGLRDIENDLYEFRIRANNAESEQDVFYALKQINARLAILDDFIRENPNDSDIDRWIAVKCEYLEIRDVLAKKKLNKKYYGVFVDYNAIDNAYPDEE